VQRHRQHAGVAREIVVGRKDREACALGHGADEEVYVRALQAARATGVEALCRAFVVPLDDRFIGKRGEPIVAASD
jgi:hypothetical protein